MIGFHDMAPRRQTFAAIADARLGRIIGGFGTMIIASALSIAAIWLIRYPADVLGAPAAGAFVTASMVATLLLGRAWLAVPLDPSTCPGPALEETVGGADALAVAETLRQAEKMETIGRCVGEFAHDFNNLLTVITLSLDRAASTAVPETRAAAYLADAAAASDHAARLVGDILAFSRRQPAIPQLVDIDRTIAAMRPLILSVAHGLMVEFEFGCGWLCRAETNQLENAVLNLVVNAKDAMPDGGCLTIKTRSLGFGAEERLDRRCEYVLLTVGDTGGGMAPDIASQAFEPFFTTKPAGRGTGLGLAQIAGFARRASGSVWIESALGHGTRVSLAIPRRLEVGPDPRPLAVRSIRSMSNNVVAVAKEFDREPPIGQ